MERKKTGRDKKSGEGEEREGCRWLLQPGVLLQLPFNRLNNCAPYTRAEIIVFCIIRMTLVRRKKYRCDDGPIEKKWSKPARNRVTQLFTNKTALQWDKLRRTSKIMQPWILSFAPPLIKPDRKECWVRPSLFLWLLLICLLLLRLNFRIVIRLRIYCIKGDIKLCIQILIQSLRIKYFLEKINTLIRLKY